MKVGFEFGLTCGLVAGSLLGIAVNTTVRKHEPYEIWREAFHGCLNGASAHKVMSMDEAAIRACIDAATLQRDIAVKGGGAK